MTRRLKLIFALLFLVGAVWKQMNQDSTDGDEIRRESEEKDISDERYKGFLFEPKYLEGGEETVLLKRYAYTSSYNIRTRNPNWVGWMLCAEHTDGIHGRKGHAFREDEDVPEPRADYDDIREGECGYQRGHMCPAGDNKWSYKAQEEAFLMTNICPQDGDLNQRDWKYLEEACREWANGFGRIYIVAGPVFFNHPYRTVGEHKVAVPDAFFKVVLALDTPNPQAIGFLYKNIPGHHNMQYYTRTVDEIEELTGLDFFYQLNDDLENVIENRYDFSKWN